MKHTIEFEVKEDTVIGGEFEDFYNWLSQCPLPKEKIRRLEK